MDNSRPTWAEIDLAALRHNMGSIKEAAKKAKVMAVVKANAYGHGVEEVTRVCLEEGADFLGVATLDEAMFIREKGIQVPILVLGYIPEKYARDIVYHDIRPAVFNFHMAQALSRAAKELSRPAYVHIKVDTGMGRLGFIPEKEAGDEIEAIHQLPGIKMEGVFTHFAVADQVDKSFTLEQLAKFEALCADLEKKGIVIPLKHAANSAALMELPETHLNMVRAGIVLYGLYPSAEVDQNQLDIIPVMRLKSRIAYLKWLPAGYTISYGRTFCCDKSTHTATVPIGYADGYNRRLSNQVSAMVRGIRVPLLGTVCMDQCMFDVSKVKGVKEGDEILLFGRPEDGVSADDLARIMETINYEVVCAVSARVPRIYIDKPRD
ncbi:alanine racemase [Syntrophomonas erecta]